MRILIIDRDDVNVQLIKAKLEPLGHQIVVEPNKNKAADRLEESIFDVVLVDPAPLNDPAPLMVNIRRAAGNYPYIILMSAEGGMERVLKSSANNILSKPLDIAALDEKIDNAKTLINLIQRIGNNEEDFPSAGGVIAKSAFNQLFLSGIDRAGRYAERTYILFIAVSNYLDIRSSEGEYVADTAVAKLAQYLVLLRRQSDIIGQTDRHELALLLQRPGFDAEPMEATKRFAEALEGHKALATESGGSIEITVSLVDLPVGSTIEKYVVMPGKEILR